MPFFTPIRPSAVDCVSLTIIIDSWMSVVNLPVVNNKQDRVPWYGSSEGDLRLSLRDYYEMTDPLLDDRLSPRMLMKFKNLYEVNSWGMLAIPLLSLPFGLGLTRLFLGR